MADAPSVDSRIRELIRQGDKLFSDRMPLMSLWQEQADNFYVERADFTRIRTIGTDFTAHLLTSYPLMVRRDLGNAISTMLRPRGQQWFSIKAEREDIEDQQSQVWLEWASGVQWRAMYDRVARFVRATKEGDHDFASFGQCVISVEMNKTRDALLFRCWHLRDVVWSETYDGKMGSVHRKWKPYACDLAAEFGDKNSPKLAAILEKEPYKQIDCRHIIVEAARYTEGPAGAGKKKWNTKYVSIYVDTTNDHVIEEIGVHSTIYVIPRWQTVSGSQYAYSPATVAGLPDGRLLQAMTRTLLEAGEKATNPPMLAVQNAVRSDINIYAGGVTWVDSVYDGKLHEVLAPLTQDFRGLPEGVELREDIRAQLKEAFYLSKLTLPQNEGQMTAYEVSERIQEYIRGALPLFEPMEDEYNGAICEEVFNLLLREGAFGRSDDIPAPLRGQSVQFRFVSPLSQAIGADKGAKFQQAAQLLQIAQPLDPHCGAEVDAVTALRDALQGIGTPAKWLASEQQAAAIRQALTQQEQAQQTMQHVSQGAGLVQQVGQAAQAINVAGAAKGVAAQAPVQAAA